MVGSIAESLIGSLLGSPLPREAAPARLTPVSNAPPASPADSPGAVFPSIPVRPDDRVEISNEARRALAELDALRTPAEPEASSVGTASGVPSSGETAAAEPASGIDPPTPEEQEEITELRDRDREVRAHEQAHKAAAGGHAGAIHYDFQTGPDGKRYAVGGHVPIDVSPVANDPQATIQKMDQIRRAALAPAEPSAADRQVAATAARQRIEAQAEMRAERVEETRGPESSGTAPAPGAESTDVSPADENPADDVAPEGFTLESLAPEAANDEGALANVSSQASSAESGRAETDRAGRVAEQNPYLSRTVSPGPVAGVGSTLDIRG